MHRSFLFAPGHNPKLLQKVFSAGADAVVLDLEDAVPPQAKITARFMVAEALDAQKAWVRVNAAGGAECAADLDAIAGLAAGIRIPKVRRRDRIRTRSLPAVDGRRRPATRPQRR